MINFKQEELIEELVNYVRERFPEAKFISVSESPEDPESLWVRVTSPEDEDRESALIEYSADKSMDILLDYGYHMLVMPTREVPA
ncbi:hypothetical protein QUF80_02980 [Desulfococcaceae bacterium HSG8]|nr:hypothetical protein [Desulfococcaceae bacterium HSG8]